MSYEPFDPSTHEIRIPEAGKPPLDLPMHDGDIENDGDSYGVLEVGKVTKNKYINELSRKIELFSEEIRRSQSAHQADLIKFDLMRWKSYFDYLVDDIAYKLRELIEEHHR